MEKIILLVLLLMHFNVHSLDKVESMEKNLISSSSVSRSGFVNLQKKLTFFFGFADRSNSTINSAIERNLEESQLLTLSENLEKSNDELSTLKKFNHFITFSVIILIGLFFYLLVFWTNQTKQQNSLLRQIHAQKKKIQIKRQISLRNTTMDTI
jgi:hypothetical protein